MIYDPEWTCPQCDCQVVDDDFCPRCGIRDPELCDHHHVPGMCDTVGCRNHCVHEFVGRQMGGPPGVADSCEWVEYCKKCGYEPQE